MSEKIAYVSIHVRIMSEQYDWLRQYSYENRVPQAEVIRKALEMYRQEMGDIPETEKPRKSELQKYKEAYEDDPLFKIKPLPLGKTNSIS